MSGRYTNKRCAVVATPVQFPELSQAALAFSERDELSAYFVSFDAERNVLLRLPGPPGRVVRGEANRRRIADPQLRARVREVAWPYDVTAALAARLTGRSNAMRRILAKLYRKFDDEVARALPPTLSVFVGQAGACAASLQEARNIGAKTVVNWNVPHWSLAQQEKAVELKRDPRWAATFGFSFWIEDLATRWKQELSEADYILTASRLSADSFVRAGYDRASILVIPYGVDLERYRIPTPVPRASDAPLRVLYVGELGQRKGLSYIFEVARQLPDMKFILRGWRMAPMGDDLPANVEVLGPTADITGDFAASDVLLFPSLYDGFGLVVLEALACGLPVITSTNAGGADVVRDGVDGFVVAPRDVDGMVSHLVTMRDDTSRLAAMKAAARSRAEDFPWRRYRNNLMRALETG